MDKEIIRIKRLAGILTEGVMAVPGIGEQSESEMQTQSTAAVNQGDADFDISQGVAEGIARGPKEKKLFELLNTWHYFISFKTVHIARTATNQDGARELSNMAKHYLGPVMNGMTFGEIMKGDLWQNPKVIPHLLKYIYQGIPYIEERIKKFVKSSDQPGYLSGVDKIKQLYKEVVAQYSQGQQGVAEGYGSCNECGSVMYEGHACGSDSMEEAKTRSKKPERFDATELAAAWGGHRVPEPGKEPGTVGVQHKTPPFSDKEDDENDEVKEGAWDTVKDISRRAANVIAPDDETLLRDLQRRAGIEPKDPHVHAKQLARDNPKNPADNFIQGGQDLDIFRETEESINEAYMSSEDAESLVLQYERMGLFDIEHQDDVLRGLSDSQLDELKTALSILIREYDLVPSLSEKYLQAYRNIEYHLGDRKSLRGLNESQELSEKKMKAKHKTKEKKLKKKYDKSGMKKSMMKQYGKEKGKQVYFAKIRGEAMKESSEFDQVFNLDDLDITIAESLYALDEAYDLNNGYEDRHYAVGDDYFPDGADSPVVDEVGPSGARQGDNPEQKKMQVATESVHRELVYEYRKFLKESS